MKILLVTSPRTTGLNYHRQIVPFSAMDIDLHVIQKWDEEATDEFLKEFQCVSFLRSINLDGKTTEIAERIKKLGLKVHFDIDDYWKLPSSHPLYKGYKAQNVEQQVMEAIKVSDFVTTTTEYLATRIKEINKNVYVLRNAINPEEPQWEIVNLPNDLTRFGYIAGVHHNKDVKVVAPAIQKALKEIKDIQVSVAGFNVNVYPNGMKQINCYYKEVEMLFTDNLKLIRDLQYKEYLKANTPEQNELTNDKNYKRLWGLDCFNYGKLYNFIDVSLVPLEQNMFSACKSELKLIEAGFMKKAVIVSNVKPYDLIINDSNCLSVHPSRNHIDWLLNIRKLCKEPNLRDDLASQLYEDVKDKYHIKTVNVERKQIFDKLCE
jgi:glycosyltransferase involved in cell wall biosynthesis